MFWLVPLILGIDLSLQSPTFTAPHREVIESTGTNPPPFYLSWDLPENSEVIQGDNIKYIGLQNFSNVLEDAKFYKALRNTLIYVLGSILLLIPLSFILSLCLFQLSKFSRGLLVFCLMIPGLALPGVLSTLFYLFFHGRTGALNQYFVVPLGFEPVNWMMDPNFIMPSLIMQAVWRWTGLVTLFFLCGLEAIPRWQFEVAKLDGLGWSQKLGQVFLPKLWHLGLFSMVFLVVDGFASFSGAYNLLGGSGGMLDAGLLR